MPRLARTSLIVWVLVAVGLLVPVQVRRVLYQFPSPFEVGPELGSAVGLYLTQPLLVVGFLAAFAGLQASARGLRPGWARRWLQWTLGAGTLGAAGGVGAALFGGAHSVVGASLAGAAAGATLGGWWIAAAEPKTDPTGPDAVRVAVSAAAALAASLLALELVWAVVGADAERASPALSWRLYSIWSVHHLVFAAFVVAFVLDHVLVRPACRWTLAAGIALWVGGDFAPGEPTHPVEAGPDRAWERAFADRLAAIDARCHGGPYLVVAASGGGSRAAATATLALGELHRLSIGGCTAHDRILAMSGVSGGALAAAHDTFDPRDPLGEVDGWRSMFVGELRRRLPASAVDGWWMRSRRVDDMFGHFDAPLLRGIHLPFVTRGASVAQFWQERFGWDGARTDDDPLLLLAATDASDGRRVTFGFPPLPTDLVVERRTYATRARVEEAYPWPVPVAVAVRASSSIPFGIDAPELDGRAFVDGAVFDNTGLDVIAAVLEGLAQAPSGSERSQLLDAVRASGVVLVEIDAGARPGGASGLAALDQLTAPSRAITQAAYPREHLLRELNRIRMCAALGGAGVADAAYVVTPNEPPGGVAAGGSDGESERDPVVTTWGLGPGDVARVIEVYAAGDLPQQITRAIAAVSGGAPEVDASHPEVTPLCP